MKKIVVVIAVVVVLAFALPTFMPQLFAGKGSPASATSPAGGIQAATEKGASAAEDAKVNIVNSVVDATGLKDAADAALRSYEGDIAAATGLDIGTIDGVIDTMAVKEWKAATLPSDAQVTSSVPFSYAGATAQITMYDDPGYISLDVFGQSLTFAVPETAQEGMQILNFI